MRTDIINKIEQMQSKGDLNTEQSVSLILQVCYELFIGQERIAKALDDRQESIDALKIQISGIKNESELHTREHETINKRIDRIENTLGSTGKEVEVIKGASIILWLNKHPKLATAIFITLFIVLNLHELITPYILGMLNYKLP